MLLRFIIGLKFIVAVFCTQSCTFSDQQEPQSKQKIFYGKDVDKVPTWHVGINSVVQSSPSDSLYDFSCGGVMIKRGVILTAAHCFKYKIPGYIDKTLNNVLSASNVLFGFKQVKDSSPHIDEYWQGVNLGFHPTKPFKIPIKKIVIHPEFDHKLNDLAIVAFDPSTFPDEYFDDLPLLNKLKDIELDLFGEKLYAIGYGNNEKTTISDYEENKVVLTPPLAMVDLNLYTPESCLQYYENYVKQHFREKEITAKLRDHINSNYRSETQICAGDLVAKKDSCSGDSGGGLLNNFLDRSKDLTLYGIVAGGPPKCGEYYPGMYTRVSAYIDWIEKTIKELDE